MRRSLTALGLLLGLLTACSASLTGAPSSGALNESGEDRVWAKIDGSYASYGEFERAQAACGVKGGMPDVAAAPSPARDYHSCMREHGWGLVSIE